MMLDKSSIIGASDNNISIISVPEWNGDVCVKRLSIRERDYLVKFYSGFVNDDGTIKTDDEAEENFAKYRLYMVGFCLCDEDGKRLFKDEEIEPLLGQKSPASIQRIFIELGKLSRDEVIKN